MDSFRPYESTYGSFNKHDYSKSSLNSIVKDLKHETAVKAKFLEDSGYEIKQAYKDFKTSHFSFTPEAIENFRKKYPELASFNPYSTEYTSEITEKAPQIKEIALDMLAESDKEIPREQWAKLFNEEFYLQDVIDFYHDIREYDGNSRVKDRYATRDNIDNAVKEHEQEFEKWLTNQFQDVYGDSYFENEKGRKFEYTLDNIISFMKKGTTKSQQLGMFNSYGIGQAKAETAKKMTSIDEIRDNASRLTTDEEIKKARELFEETDENLRTEIGEKRISEGDDLFDVYSDYYRALAKTANGTKPEVALKQFGFNDITDEQINSFKETAIKLKNLPMKYFEAKPQRAVGLDEVKALVIPNNLDTDLRQQLVDRGMRLIEYDPNIEGDREAKLKSAELQDLRFSQQTETADEIINRLLEKYKPDISNEPKLPGIPKNLPKDYKSELLDRVNTMQMNKDGKKKLTDFVNSYAQWGEEDYNDVMNQISAVEQKYIQAKEQKQRDRFTTKSYDNPDRAKLITQKRNEFNKDYHYNDTLVDEIDSLLPRNRNGKRLVREWKKFARELGKRLALDNYTPDEIEDIAVKSYYDLQPTKNITQYDKGSKAPRERLYANDWVNSVYEGLNEAGYDATKYSITDNGQNVETGEQRNNENLNKMQQIAKEYIKFREIGEQAKEGKITDEEFLKEPYSDNVRNMLKDLGYSNKEAEDIIASLADLNGKDLNPKNIERIINLHSFSDVMEREKYRAEIIREREEEQAKLPEQPILPEQQTPQLPQVIESTQPTQVDEDLQAIRDNSLLNLEQNGKSRKHYKTYTESESLSRKDRNQAKKLYQDELYIPVHNVDSLAKANDRIRTNGIDNEYTAAMTNFTNGNKASLDDIVTMERMIQIYSAQGETEKVNELMQNVAILGTELGQRVQALSIIKKMSPEGQLQALHKLIDRTNKKEGTDLKITDEQANKILNSNGEKQLQDNVSKVVEEVAKDLKVTFGDEVRAWRYFSMLGNPRTHIRNLVGNTFMNALQGIKNKVAGAGEDIVSLFNPNLERTKTLKIANRDQRDFAKIDSYTMQDVIDGGGKYDMKNMLQQAKRSSNIPLLNAMENFNSNLLDKEDKVFLRVAYEQAMRNYMAANNLSKKDMQKKENLEKARQYATLSAQEATFHQFNSIAQILSQLENKGGVTGFLTSAVLPFKKTPMNIAKTGLEYSPIGIASAATNTFNNIFKDSKKLKTQLEKNNITQEQYNSAISDMVNKRIDQMAKGLTGTAIAVLGYVLAKNGVIKAGNGDDEDEFEEKLGNQTFSIRIGDQTYSLDWLAPSAIPLFVGANMSNLVNGDEESTEEETFYDRLGKFTNTTATSLAQAFEPMTEMSMLQGLSSAISSYEQDSSSKLFDIGASAVQSYGGQFIPTALGQVAKTIDPVVRDTTSTKKGMAKKIDQFVNQQKAKIPVLSKTLPAKTNVWGEDKERPENALVRFLENAVAPYNREKIIEDTTSEKLKEVYEETGEKGALPGTVQKYVTINSEKYDLNNKDFNQAKRVYGKVAKKTLDSVISNRSFDSLDPNVKAKLIGDIYSYAKEEFKDEFAKNKGLEFEHKVSNSKKKYAAFKEYESGTKSLSELIEEFYTEKGE